MASVGTVLRKRLGQFIAGRNPTPRPRPFGEMGTSGTAVWGGYVQVKERSPQWIGRQKYITSSELAVNTSIVAAGVHYFLNLVAHPNWTFRATDEDDEEALALAEFADNVVNDMDTPWYKVVRRAAMYRFHGFGLQEWTAKHRDDGLIGFKDIEARPQQTIEQWDIDIDGTVLGVWQRSPQTGAMLGIPRDKLLYLVEDTLTDSPEGIGMFRHMADPYQRLKQLQDLEIRAYERDLRGTPIARAPLTMLDRAVSQGVIKQAEADAMVRDFEALVKIQVKQSDTGIVMDSLPYFSDSDSGDTVSAVPQWNFELLSGGGVGHAEVAAGIERIQREIARIIGVEALMMGGDMSANRSLSEDKSRNLYLVANSVLKYIGSRVKDDILIPLWKLNGFPMKKMPEPKPEDVTFKNVDAITSAIQKMAAAGAPLSPTDPVTNDVRDLLGVSRVPDDVMAQGAMPQNPLLAGLPPQLQFGAKGQQPINLGAGSPGKQPGMGGGALPGQGGFDPTKKFIKEDKDVRRKPRRRLNGEAVGGDREALDTSLAARRQVAVDQADGRGQYDPQEAVRIEKPTRAFGAGSLGTPGNLNDDERPVEDPTKPGYIDMEHEQAKVKETIDEPPQVQQAVLGSANPLRPEYPKPGPAGAGVKPADGKPVPELPELPEADVARASSQPTIGGIPVEQKGHGKVEVDAEFLVQLINRLSAKPGAPGQPQDATAGQPVEGAPKVEAGKDKVEGLPDLARPAAKPAEAAPGMSPTTVDQATIKPQRGEPPGKKVAPEAAAQLAGAGTKKPGAIPAPPGQAKPSVQPGQPGKVPPQAGKDPTAAGGVPGAPGKPGMPPDLAGAAGKPPMQPGVQPGVGEAGGLDPSQPGAVDPATGQPIQPPGAPPAAEPEMTPDRASEILQPYAEHEKAPEETEPRTESDVLWSRLGEEKDVQANVTHVDPETGETVVGPPVNPEDPLAGGLSLEAEDGMDETDVLAEPPVGEDETADAEEAATRDRLRQYLEGEADDVGVQAADDSADVGLPVEEGQPLEEEGQPLEEEVRLARERLPPEKLRPKEKLKPRGPRVRL